VTDVAAGTVSIIDTAARKTVATVPVGTKPNGVSHWHPGGAMP
jgi:YVTN family beta-propeller protein